MNQFSYMLSNVTFLCLYAYLNGMLVTIQFHVMLLTHYYVTNFVSGNLLQIIIEIPVPSLVCKYPKVVITQLHHERLVQMHFI
jgi:hypothetical protein